MPLERFSTKQVLANHRANPAARTRPLPNATPFVFRPALRPGFSITPDTEIFTMGSCFARNFERALHAAGFSSPAIDTFNKLHLRDGDTEISFAKHLKPDDPAEGVLNKYTLPSMLLDAQSVAKGTGHLDTLYETADGNFWNGGLHLSEPLPRNLAEQLAEHVFQNTRRMSDADVVVLTLGLIEAWFDALDNRYLNEKPPGRLALDSRFECHVLSYGDCKVALSSLVDTIRTLNPDCHIVITVSPVVLHATMGPGDVRVRNTYAKSTLRAVCEEISVKKPKVEYFPSFEMATLSDRQIAYYNDGIHIRQDFVDTIIHHFLGAYGAPELLERPEMACLALSASLVTADPLVGAYHYANGADRILAGDNLQECILLKQYAAMVDDKKLDKKLFSKVKQLTGQIGFSRVFGAM